MPSGKTSVRGMRILSFWLIAALVILIDQGTKAAVREVAPNLGRFGTLIPGVIDLVHVENTGAAFSIGTGAGIIFIVLALVVVAGTTAFVYTQDIPMALTCSLACVAGGGVGNMVDRILFGSVTDFLATTFIDFPVFNVADIFVSCGIAVSFILFLRWDKRREQPDETMVGE